MNMNDIQFDPKALWYQGCAISLEGEESEKIAVLDKLEKSGQYYAQPKCDGIWASLWGEGGQTRAFSRNRLEKADHGLPGVGDGNCIVGELGYGSQHSKERKKKLGYSFADVFDILWFDGHYVGDRGERSRRGILKSWWYSLPEDTRKHFILLPVWLDRFSDRYVKEHEGLVVKKKNLGAWQCGTKHPDWIKAKKEQDYDVVIMGWELSNATTKVAEPMCKNVVVGQYIGGQLKRMGKVGSIPHELSKKIAQDFGKFTGRVIVVRSNMRFNSGSFRHIKLAPFVGEYPFRDDKNPEDCTWEPK